MYQEFNAQPWEVSSGLAGYCWEVENPSALILLQHGYGEYACRYYHSHEKLIQRLQSLNYSVYAFDLRGHGGSVGARGQTDVCQAVRDHIAARRILETKKRPIFLIGHSLGGLVTAASAAQLAGGVAGVVLLSPAIQERTAFFGNKALTVLARLLSLFPVTPLSPLDGLSRKREVVKQYLSDPYVFIRKVRGLLGCTALISSNTCWDRAANWHVPTFLAHGLDDTYTSAQISSELIHLIAAEQKLIWTIPEARHELLNDLCAGDVLGRISNWMIDILQDRADRLSVK
ncbi:TPA: alpha/beta fold hydrolase [Pseudomonas aeruginosa]